MVRPDGPWNDVTRLNILHVVGPTVERHVMHGGVSAGGDHDSEENHGHDHGPGWERVETVAFGVLFVGAIALAYLPKAMGFGWVGYQWALVALWALAYLVVEYGDLPHRLPAGLVGTVQDEDHSEHAD